MAVTRRRAPTTPPLTGDPRRPAPGDRRGPGRLPFSPSPRRRPLTGGIPERSNPAPKPPTGGIPERPGMPSGPRKSLPKRPAVSPARMSQNARLLSRVRKWGWDGYQRRFSDKNERQQLPSWLSRKGELRGGLPGGPRPAPTRRRAARSTGRARNGHIFD